LWRRGTTPHRFYVHHKPKPKTKPISSHAGVIMSDEEKKETFFASLATRGWTMLKDQCFTLQVAKL